MASVCPPNKLDLGTIIIGEPEVFVLYLAEYKVTSPILLPLAMVGKELIAQFNVLISVERLRQIVNDVLDIFDADRQSDQTRTNATGLDRFLVLNDRNCAGWMRRQRM